MMPPTLEAPPAFALTRALVWRQINEGKWRLLTPVLLFAGVLAVVVVTSLIGTVNSPASFLSVASRYASGGHALTAGVLLSVGPALAGIFNSISVTRAAQATVGAEISSGGIEELLGSPYTPRRIITAIFGHMAITAAGFWAAYMFIITATTVVLTLTASVELHPSPAYLALALLLPLLVALAGGSLSILISVLFPGFAQIGGTAALTNGNLGNLTALLPALGCLFALAFGLPRFGAAPLLLLAGGATILITAGAVALATSCFNTERLLTP